MLLAQHATAAGHRLSQQRHGLCQLAHLVAHDRQAVDRVQRVLVLVPQRPPARVERLLEQRQGQLWPQWATDGGRNPFLAGTA